MHSSQSWFVPALAIIVLIGIVPVYFFVRAWRQRARLTREERAEFSGSPLTRLQKAAWSELAVGVATLGSIIVLLGRFGVAEYWDNDDFRLVVLAVFIAGLIGCAALLGVAASRLDERDNKVLSQAGTYQTGFIIVGMAVWSVALGERFHDAGAVPMVYVYLMFGSTILVNFIGQSVGVLLGYWIGDRFGKA